jgi:hypothetical protein
MHIFVCIPSNFYNSGLMFADLGMNVIQFDFTSDEFYLESVLPLLNVSWFLRFSVVKRSVEQSIIKSVKFFSDSLLLKETLSKIFTVRHT